MTTEINTLFQTITSIAEKVDPVKLNLTVPAAAAQSLSNGAVRPVDGTRQHRCLMMRIRQMPQARKDIQQLAALGDNVCKRGAKSAKS